MTARLGPQLGVKKLKRMQNIIRDTYDGMANKEEFNKLVLDRYAKVLKKEALTQAGFHSQTGELKRGVRVERGGAGRGNRAVRLRVVGPARRYAKILNFGGIIHAKNHKYLTIPTAQNLDSKKRKKKTAWDILDRESFIVKKRRGAWVGELVWYRKQRRIIGARRVRSAITGNLVQRPYKLTPLFILKKKQRVRPTFWASKAMKAAHKKIHGFIRNYAKTRVKKR